MTIDRKARDLEPWAFAFAGPESKLKNSGAFSRLPNSTGRGAPTSRPVVFWRTAGQGVGNAMMNHYFSSEQRKPNTRVIR